MHLLNQLKSQFLSMDLTETIEFNLKQMNLPSNICETVVVIHCHMTLRSSMFDLLESRANLIDYIQI